MKNKCHNLTKHKQKDLLKLLPKFEELFEVTLSTWKTDSVYFKILKQICSRIYPVPKVYTDSFKIEVDRLVLIGVLEKSK